MPFGKYSDILTTVVALGVIVAAITNHLLNLSLFTHDTGLIDVWAAVAFGAMFGRTSASNGYAAQAIAAHKRLDLIGAPQASDSTPPPAAVPLTDNQTGK